MNINFVEINQRCNYSSVSAVAWLSMRLQLLASLTVGTISLISVFEHLYFSDKNSPSGKNIELNAQNFSYVTKKNYIVLVLFLI